MACSEIRSTRRTFLSTTAAVIAASPAAGLAEQKQASSQGDPVVALWRDWFMAYRLRAEACRRQQKLETDLLRQFGSVPRVKIPLSGDGVFMWAYSNEEIDRLLPDSDQEHMRRDARVELTARCQEWTCADTRIGYTKARTAEIEIAEVEKSLATELWKTSSQSVAGVAAKLHALLETEDPGSGMNEPPWPELRHVLDDLVRFCSATGPDYSSGMPSSKPS